MKLREQNLTLQFVSIFFLKMRNLEFRVYSIHFCRRRSQPRIQFNPRPVSLSVHLFQLKKINCWIFGQLTYSSVNHLPQSRSKSFSTPSHETKTCRTWEEKGAHYAYIPLPSMEVRTLCLSTETSSQDEAEGSNVYLPTDGLIKDAMMSENRKNPIDNRR